MLQGLHLGMQYRMEHQAFNLGGLGGSDNVFPDNFLFLAHIRADVVDSPAARCRLGNGIRIQQVTVDDFGCSERAQRGVCRRMAHHRAHRLAVSREPLDHRSAGFAAGAGNQNHLLSPSDRNNSETEH